MPDDLQRLLDSLNEQQREAVEAPPGPLLVLAGAGSGKTRVLTCRIASFIRFRRISPWNILAVTFTNKAADEMAERVRRLLPGRDMDVPVATFHRTCARILRRHIDRLGFKSNYSILDDADQVRLLKQVLDYLGLERRMVDARLFRALIDRAKNSFQGPDEVDARGLGGVASHLPEVYRRYQERLKQMNLLDFGDLICHTVTLLDTFPDVRAYYQGRFRHLMVDEYQDTNRAQYRLTQLLVDPGAPSICVVGDEDQSIYGFRGADVSHIVEFEKDFPGTKVIKLEKNYRSTGKILRAASAVVENNEYRLGKTLVSVRGEGEFIRYLDTQSDYDEASRVAEEVRRLRGAGFGYDDMAVFYRANFQSRLLEETFRFQEIPYLLVGQGFFDRKEIKDMRAYLQLIYNPADDVALDRILNVPARGIGAKARSHLFRRARAENVSCYRVLEEIARDPAAHKPHGVKLRRFFQVMETLRDQSGTLELPELLIRVLEETGYREKLVKAGDIESEGRLENIQEFINMAAQQPIPSGRDGLRTFLEHISLHSQADEVVSHDGRVTLMTLHNAKGLEFPVVFIVGMEDGLFPHERTVASQKELEEERRLCYVGMTRAMDRLFLLRARRRHMQGELKLTRPSRFLLELPPELIRGRTGVAPGRFACTLTPGTTKAWDAHRGPGRAGSGDVAVEAASQAGERRPDVRDVDPVDADAFRDFRPGQRVSHPSFGDGIIMRRFGASDNPRLVIDFDATGVKRIAARYAGLEPLYGQADGGMFNDRRNR